ncbi:hypothetical protein HR12_27610, partial [Microbacterium sp. SUBG005]
RSRPDRSRGHLGRRDRPRDQRPLIGWGFSTPWIASEPLIDGWIVDHGQTVVQAHSMWLDAYLQLGGIGVVLLALVYLAYVWRSWFFAVDRPRWDLRDDRPIPAHAPAHPHRRAPRRAGADRVRPAAAVGLDVR